MPGLHRSLRLLPGIQKRHPHRFKVSNIARDERHAMNERGGGDETIAIGARGRRVEFCAFLCNHCIDGQCSTSKRGNHVIVEPFAKERALLLVFAFFEQYAEFDFLHRDDRDKQSVRIDRFRPIRDVLVGFSRFDFAKFGDDIRIKKKHNATPLLLLWNGSVSMTA
jgi:hypothetical protein